MTDIRVIAAHRRNAPSACIHQLGQRDTRDSGVNTRNQLRELGPHLRDIDTQSREEDIQTIEKPKDAEL